MSDLKVFFSFLVGKSLFFLLGEEKARRELAWVAERRYICQAAKILQ